MSNDQLVKNATLAVRNVIKTSSSLALNDVKFMRSLDQQFNDESVVVSGRLMDLANEVIEAVGDDNEKIDDNDEDFKGSNMKKVSNVLDTLFEKADFLFDEVRKGSKQDKQFTFLEESNNVVKDESKNIGRKMDKPQLNFQVAVDNSELQPFKPKLPEKPNSLKSWQEPIIVTPDNEDDDPPFYPHPYEHEIDNQPYPEEILSKSDVIPSQPWESTSAIWIDKPEQLPGLVKELAKSKELAIDLEHHDYRTYYGLVCLMQISNREKDWIIDTLALRDELHVLNKVFTDPMIIKIFHGAFMDIIWLQRDLGLYIVSLFDTYHASKKLGFPKFSLAYLLETFANFKTSKKYQLADWRIRPLSPSMLAYARSDTHFLLNIFDQLRNKLIDNDKMSQVLYDSRQVAKRRFEYTSFRPKNSHLVSCPVMASNPREPWGSLLSSFGINSHLKPVVEVLYNWRDKLARQLDESVRFVMPNQTLASLATLSRPVDNKKVLTVAPNEYIRNNAQELATLINDTLELSEANDWKLFDKVESSVPEDIPVSNNTIESQNSIFNQLVKENNLLSNEFQSKPSMLFSQEKELIGVSFDNNNINESTVDELSSRYDRVYQEFEKYKVTVEVNIPKEEVVPDIPKKEIKQPEPEPQPQPKEDKDEIITLRKSKKQRVNKKRSADEETFDYSAADNIMNTKIVNEPKRRKKFDPYSNSDAPKPVRGGRNMKSGRSSTFKR
ncbi:exosome complex exonuclease Rrp6p [[Candida] jaroonii]|uniref:Exosome complex exonuclease Rrp6p n=1 Tax=[Candida] jaroonii TaxID=467808 RepID=A0ACA9YFB6_9ASCO|nr:exosome complex exonuclease Rrp6p [[Candida] jaroonii]